MSVESGKRCVECVAGICDALGYSVFVPERETCLPFDMECNGLRVQVKQRCSPKEQPNRVRLKTNFGSGTVAYTDGDFDVLVIRWFDQWYVIPSSALTRRDGCIMNGIYMPSVAEWRDRWEVLEAERVYYSQQKCFDF